MPCVTFAKMAPLNSLQKEEDILRAPYPINRDIGVRLSIEEVVNDEDRIKDDVSLVIINESMAYLNINGTYLY